MKENVVQVKSYAFALRMMKLYRWLCEKEKAFALATQVLQSGTSIGANVEEAIGGQSEKDFNSKMNIAYKEARETHYWLRLLRDSGMMDEKAFGSIIADCEELMKIIGSINKTMKSKIKTQIHNS
ncbi:MAG: four helix bundle protein [Thermodesulfobacteriota bacterium]